MKISFIIVNYNSSNYVLKLLKSIEDNVSEKNNYEIIIIDNNSYDNSYLMLKSNVPEAVKLIQSDENLGFAKANNLACKFATGDVYFFLNPDTKLLQPFGVDIIPKEMLGKLYFTTRVVDESLVGYNNIFCFPFISNYFKKTFFGACDVWVQGSVLVMSKKIFESVGGWPEDYFMYAEDMDMSYSLLRKGYSLKKLDYTIMHVRGGVTKNIWSDSQRSAKTNASLKKFMYKYGYQLDYWIYILFKSFRLKLVGK